MQTDEHLSPAQFARLAQLSLNHVYALIWSGRLQAEKTSEGKWAIPASALQERREAVAQ